MIDIRQKLRVVFEAEAKDHLARIRSILAKDGSATRGPNLDEVFRRAHSLKGAARAVDLREVESLAHPLETLFARIREGAMVLDDAALGVIHKVLDSIEGGVAGHTGNGALKALEAIAKLLSGAAALPSVSAPLVEQGASSRPPPPPQVSGPSNQTKIEADTLRVGAATIERVHRSAGDLTTEASRQDLLTTRVGALSGQIERLAREGEQLRRTSAAALRRMESDPGLARVSRYVEFMERQVSALSKDARALSLLQKRGAWSMRNIGERLQQDVCAARMTMAEEVFDSFGKMLRDLARDEGREVEFRAIGMEVQADRLVLQTLKDPLMHLLRNSLAHGIEPAQERVQAGKKPAGSVQLRLETRANKLVMTVEDDGRGVDITKVLKIAVAKGILTEDAAAKLSPDEKLRLIFHPGLSTARAVTELSGRGIGLNVVADAAARLQGSVTVAPAPSGGTRFVLTVPLTLSASRLLLVKCGPQTFALPSHAIDRLIQVKVADLVTVEDRPSVNLQGTLLPLTALSHLLRLDGARLLIDRATLSVVIVKSGGKRLAVAVDAMVTEMESVIRELSPMILKYGGLGGAITLGDGSVVFVLNVEELLENFRRSERFALSSGAAPQAIKRIPTILVVDDSMTTRTLEKSILEAHGYRVLVAVDGIEALVKLRSEVIDLVVSDVEMPRLDGFGLLQEVRKDPELNKIPTLLVTSLEKREDKERGLALGADGYIVKRKFDQKVLLDTVRQLI